MEPRLLLPMCISSLLGVGDSHRGGGGGAFPGGFCNLLFLQNAIISFIKFYIVSGLDELHGVNFFFINVTFYVLEVVV